METVIIQWDGTELPQELRDLPPGRYRVEALHEPLTALPEAERSFAAEIRRHQKTPQEVAQLGAGVKPFSYAEWQHQAPAATPEELADWEALREHREAERTASIERDRELGQRP